MTITTRIDHLQELMYQFSTPRTRTKASYQRMRRAAKVLGLTDAEVVELETILDYRPTTGEDLYPAFRSVK